MDLSCPEHQLEKVTMAKSETFELLKVIRNTASLQVTIAKPNVKKLKIKAGTRVKQWVFDPDRDTAKKGDLICRIVELTED